MEYTEFTIFVETENYTDYLVITLPKDEKLSDEIVKEEFELYSNDEAGKKLKGESLTDWGIIRKD